MRCALSSSSPGEEGIFLGTHGSGRGDHPPLMENEQRVALSSHVGSLPTSTAVPSVSFTLARGTGEPSRCRSHHAGCTPESVSGQAKCSHHHRKQETRAAVLATLITLIAAFLSHAHVRRNNINIHTCTP